MNLPVYSKEKNNTPLETCLVWRFLTMLMVWGFIMLASNGQAQKFFPVGSEFQVNTTIVNVYDGGDKYPSVGMDKNGNFVILWTRYTTSGDSLTVIARKYELPGTPLTGEFQVPHPSNNSGFSPSIAMKEDESFIVTWGQVPIGYFDYDVKAGFFNFDGSIQGSQFIVNTYTEHYQSSSDVAMSGEGSFVVVWRSWEQDPDGSHGIYAQRYNATGIAEGGEFRVNATIAGNQEDPKVAIDKNRNFVVVWCNPGQDPDGSRGIYAQRYNAAGIAQGGEFRVNTTTNGHQESPVIAMDQSGNFTIVWSDRDQDPDGSTSVYAQRYNAAGVAQGGEFRVNTTTEDNQSSPAIAMDQSGDFIIAWGTTNVGIFGQCYKADGMLNGSEFKISTNTSIPGGTGTPDIAMDDQGNCVVSWGSGGNLIYAQRFKEFPPAYINGPEIAANNGMNSYTVVPNYDFYSYEWSYSDPTTLTAGTTERTVTLGFSQAGTGTLQCILSNDDVAGQNIDTLYLDIIVNQATNLHLPSLCPDIAPYDPCVGGFIDAFSLSDVLQSESSECSPSGYADFTQSGVDTKLYLGDVYSAELKTGYNGLGDPVFYAGVWIDYNNNGTFDDAGEFIASSFESDSIIHLSYLPISADKNFEGPRRLRVRVRTSGPFTTEEGCVQVSEAGETEDYVVFLMQHDRLEGAHLVTPNNDGKNDFFVIRGIDSEAVNSLTVFDHLGKNLFSKDGYINDWSGTDSSGELLPPGMYYYVFINGDDTLKGFFQLNY